MWNPGFILIIVIAVVGMIVQAALTHPHMVGHLSSRSIRK